MKKEDPVIKGAFAESLVRTANQIRKDRAEGISEDAETFYRREIEDMKVELKRLQRDRRNELDLSPDDINTIINGKNFDGEGWVKRDIQAGIKIRNLKVKIEIAEERYEYLFGEEKADAPAINTGSEPATVE